MFSTRRLKSPSQQYTSFPFDLGSICSHSKIQFISIDNIVIVMRGDGMAIMNCDETKTDPRKDAEKISCSVGADIRVTVLGGRKCHSYGNTWKKYPRLAGEW